MAHNETCLKPLKDPRSVFAPRAVHDIIEQLEHTFRAPERKDVLPPLGLEGRGEPSMNPSIVRCEIEEAVATIVMDDGKQNVISPRMIRQLHRALNTAEKERAVVVLTGREGVFCSGFDLNILKSGVLDAFKMLIGGFELAARLLAFRTPVVVACSGHAVAMGAFLLLAGDDRLGAAGPFKIVTNEVAIGLTMPFAGIEICRQRLVPAHFVRAALLAEEHTPESAVEAGFLDRVVPAEDLLRESVDVARRLARLDLNAHYETKLRARRQTLVALKRAILRDRFDFIAKGMRRLLGNTFRK